MDNASGKVFEASLRSFAAQRFAAALHMVQQCDSEQAFTGAVMLHQFDQLASTNQTAWGLFEQAASEGTVVIALEQTAGRGQWGRQWLSSRGGLYLSALLLPDLPVEHAAQLTIAPALGIAKALRDIPGRLSGVETVLPIQLKWLNDLVIDRRKLGGILTETRMQQGRITKAVVGVGINWCNPVPAHAVTLRSLLEAEPIPLIESLELLAAITIHGLLAGYQRWQRQGIEPLLEEYTNLLRPRRVELPEGAGTIVGVTATGELRVRLEIAHNSVSAATVNNTTAEILRKPGTISLGYSPTEDAL